jgi:hypothetical protein
MTDKPNPARAVGCVVALLLLVPAEVALLAFAVTHATEFLTVLGVLVLIAVIRRRFRRN